MHTYERTHERTHAFARAGPCACAREHTHMRGGARRATLSAYKGSMHLCRRTDKRVRLLCVYVLGGGGGGLWAESVRDLRVCACFAGGARAPAPQRREPAAGGYRYNPRTPPETPAEIGGFVAAQMNMEREDDGLGTVTDEAVGLRIPNIWLRRNRARRCSVLANPGTTDASRHMRRPRFGLDAEAFESRLKRKGNPESQTKTLRTMHPIKLE